MFFYYRFLFNFWLEKCLYDLKFFHYIEAGFAGSNRICPEEYSMCTQEKFMSCCLGTQALPVTIRSVCSNLWFRCLTFYLVGVPIIKSAVLQCFNSIVKFSMYVFNSRSFCYPILEKNLRHICLYYYTLLNDWHSYHKVSFFRWWCICLKVCFN